MGVEFAYIEALGVVGTVPRAVTDLAAREALVVLVAGAVDIHRDDIGTPNRSRRTRRGA